MMFSTFILSTLLNRIIELSECGQDKFVNKLCESMEGIIEYILAVGLERENGFIKKILEMMDKK